MFEENLVEIIINERILRCEKKEVIRISPLVREYFEDNEESNHFVTEVENFDTLIKGKTGNNNRDREEIEINNLQKILNGKQIEVNFDNFELFSAFSKHFRIYTLNQKIHEFENYLDNITKYIEGNEELETLKKIEILLRSLNSENFKEEISKEETVMFLRSIDQMLLIQAIYGIFLLGTQQTCNNFMIELIIELNSIKPGILTSFVQMIINKVDNTQFADIRNYLNNELFLLLHQLFEYNLANEGQITQKLSLIFVDFLNDNEKIVLNEMFKAIDESYLDDNYRLHKKACELGVYPDALEISIRNDDLSNCQNIIAHRYEDINQLVKTSIYEKNSFVNDGNCSLLEYAAFFGARNCFKFLLSNRAEMDKQRIGKFAIAGGDEEIIHICHQAECSFKRTVNIAIRYHHNDIAIWLIENRLDSIDSNESFDSDKSPLKQSLESFNIEMMVYLLERGQDVESIVNFSSFANNIILLKWIMKYYKENNINVDQYITYDIKGVFKLIVFFK